MKLELITEHLSQSKDAASEDTDCDEELVCCAKHSAQVVRRNFSQIQRRQLRCHAYNHQQHCHLCIKEMMGRVPM